MRFNPATPYVHDAVPMRQISTPSDASNREEGKKKKYPLVVSVQVLSLAQEGSINSLIAALKDLKSTGFVT